MVLAHSYFYSTFAYQIRLFMSKAAQTRMSILQKSFELIYRKGYQATSIDDIIATTQVTKGAFYYHFKNKDEMAVALINDYMRPNMYEVMLRPLQQTEKPLEAIYNMMRGLLHDTDFFDVRYGCPAFNLIEEMAPLNETFRKALSVLMTDWRTAITDCLVSEQQQQTIRPDRNPQQIALFIMTGYGGIRNIGKLEGTSCYDLYLEELKNYLTGLKPTFSV